MTFTCSGLFPPRRSGSGYNPRDRIILDPAQESEKRSIIENQKRSGKTVHILPLYRFRSLSEDPGGIIFDLGYTDFGEYLLTDISHPEWNAAERGNADVQPALDLRGNGIFRSLPADGIPECCRCRARQEKSRPSRAGTSTPPTSLWRPWRTSCGKNWR